MAGIACHSRQHSLEIAARERPLAYGDIVYLTIQNEGKEYLLEFFDHHQTVKLTPKKEKTLIGNSLFQIKEELIRGSRDEKYLEKRLGEKLKPGARLNFLHLLSANYLFIDIDAAMETRFGSRRTLMKSDECVNFCAFLQTSSVSFKEELVASDNILLQIEESNGFFNLSADFSAKGQPLYFGVDQHQPWHIHVYTPGEDLISNVINYGLPILLHNKHTGKYLATKKAGEPVRMSVNRSLGAMWVLEGPADGMGSAGNFGETVRLQHFLTGAYLSHNRTLSNVCSDPQTFVEFSSYPLDISHFFSLKVGGDYLKVELSSTSETLKDSILSMVPGVECNLETAFVSEVTNAELCEFEIIRQNRDLVAMAYNIRGAKEDILAYKKRILDAYARRNAGFDADQLGQDEFISSIGSMMNWLETAKTQNFLPEFLEMYMDVDLHTDLAVITTYSYLLELHGLGKDTSHIRFQEVMFHSNRVAWQMLEYPESRRLVELAPQAWVPVLTEMFTDVQCSGYVGLQTLKSIFAVHKNICEQEEQGSEAAVKCIRVILQSIQSKHSGLISALKLDEYLLMIREHAKFPITLNFKEYSLDNVHEIYGMLELYIQVTSQCVHTEFLRLKEMMFAGAQVGPRTILDQLMALEDNKMHLVMSANALKSWGRLIELNIIMKARSTLSYFTVSAALEVIGRFPDFINPDDEFLHYEMQKWTTFQFILTKSDQISAWKNGIFEYIAGCLYSLNFLVNHFLLTPDKVITVVKEVYGLLNAFTSKEHFLLPTTWTQAEIQVLSKLIFDGKKKRYGSIAKCFERALETLHTCYGFFELLTVTEGKMGDKSLLLTSRIREGPKTPKDLLLPTLTKLLKSIVKDLKDNFYMQDSIETLAHLIGVGKKFTSICEAAAIRKITLNSEIAMKLCEQIDAVVCLDVLQSLMSGESAINTRISEIKEGLQWLITVTESCKNDPEQLSSVLKILTSLNLTNSLLLLFELMTQVKDPELTALVLNLTMNVCNQYPENKAKVLEYLYTLDFTIELPSFIELLDMFGFLADMNIHQIQLLASEMVKGYIAHKGTYLEALAKLIEAHRSLVPLIAISSVLMQAISEWTTDPADLTAILVVFRYIAVIDDKLQGLFSSNSRIQQIITDLKLPPINYKEPKKPIDFAERIEIIKKPTKIDQLRKIKTMVASKLTLLDFEMKPSELVQTKPIGHLTVIKFLEKAKSIPLILESFQESSSDIDKPMYAVTLHLFKAIGNSLKTKKGENMISPPTVKTLMTSDMHIVMLYLLLRMRSPKHIMILLKCLRRAMQINSYGIKERILAALIENKNYFYLFNSFFRLCEQYKADVAKPSSPHFTLLKEYLKFFTAGCDLCNEGFQNFIREQMEGSGTNIDILQTSLSIMNSVREVVENNMRRGREATFQQKKVMMLMMSLLTEAISGPNLRNQSDVGSSEILYHSLNTIMKLLKLEAEECQTVFSLLSLLSALLEKDDKDEGTGQRDVMKAMAITFGFYNLQELMLKVKILSNLPNSPPDLRNIGVRICIFLCDFQIKASACNLLEVMDGPARKKIHPDQFLLSADVKKAVEEYSKFVGSVEVEKDKTIYNVLFPLHPSSQMLTAYTKDQLLRTIHQQPLRQEKLDDFLNGVKTCLVEISIQEARPIWVMKWSPYWLFFSRLSFIIALVINLLLMYTIRGTYHHNRFYMSVELKRVLDVLGIAQCAAYFFAMFLYWNTYYYTLYYPLVAKSSTMDVRDLATDRDLNKYRSPYQIEEVEIQQGQEKSIQMNNVVWLLYNLAFVGVSVFSIRYRPLYAILMLGVFSQNERFDTMLRALMMNWQLLGITALLMCIVIYEFSMIAYLNFAEYYNYQPNLACDDLFNCFISTLNMGLRGGLGDALSEIKEEDYWPRLLFDVSFQVIIMMIFLNIVFGIIIDAFGDLRDERTRIEQDVNNNCLICGRDRSTIDLRGETWKKHVTQVHSYENYLNFIIYVIKKRIEDCSGIEKYVKEQVSKNSVSFMPTNSALLKKYDCQIEAAEEQEEIERQEKMLDQIREKVKELKQLRA